MWQWLSILTNLKINNLYSLILCESDYVVEYLKSVIFKMLIQIDRSQHVTLAGFKSIIKHWISIEITNNRSKIANASRAYFERVLDAIERI